MRLLGKTRRPKNTEHVIGAAQVRHAGSSDIISGNLGDPGQSCVCPAANERRRPPGAAGQNTEAAENLHLPQDGGAQHQNQAASTRTAARRL